MKKNIVLCSDGTGNKGGSTPDSNVYKTYKLIDKHYTDRDKGISEQVVFYDNGVGTQANKIWRGLSAGLGVGFNQNVKDLYRFLARNYHKGDDIYLFGFSRGAATIRAFSGFLACCGLVKSVDEHHVPLSSKALEERIDEAMRLYKYKGADAEESQAFREESDVSFGVVDIHFIGVWDTVSALGFPQKTDINALGMRVLNKLFVGLDKLTDVGIFKHNFYNYELTSNVKHAYQALAIDDERTAFWPLVWDENSDAAKAVDVQQVWFSGMHSNVGGGYGRSGLANVSLHWMLARPELAGLKLERGAIESIHECAHEHGRMHDSRDGTGIFYRYHPRDMTTLSQYEGGENKGESKLREGIKVHQSVLERLRHRTGNYTPTHLPGVFDVVRYGVTAPLTLAPKNMHIEELPEWEDVQKSVNKTVTVRKWLYSLLLEVSLAIVGIAFCFWNGWWFREDIVGSVLHQASQLNGHIADVLHYVLPDMFTNLIEVAVIRSPEWFYGFTAFIVSYWFVRASYRKATICEGEKLRRFVNRCYDAK